MKTIETSGWEYYYVNGSKNEINAVFYEWKEFIVLIDHYCGILKARWFLSAKYSDCQWFKVDKNTKYFCPQSYEFQWEFLCLWMEWDDRNVKVWKNMYDREVQGQIKNPYSTQKIYAVKYLISVTQEKYQ